MQLGKLLIATGLLLAACGVAADHGLLIDRLRIDHAAKVAAEQDFRDQRQRGSLNGAEAADYAAYIARLHRQVAEDCAALAATGSPQPSDLGCASLPPPGLVPAPIDQAGEQTVDEQIAVLDAELFSGLGEFDEMLLREQERIRAAAPIVDAATDAGGGAGGAGTTATADGESGSASDGGRDGVASEGDAAGAGSQQQDGRQGTPPNIPDGSDDDVVARQLREAAEKETDPELKKKLWEEYRKYKEGTR